MSDEMIPEALDFFQDLEELAKRHGLAAFLCGVMFERDGEPMIYGNGGSRLDPTAASSADAMKRMGSTVDGIVRRFGAVYADARKPRILN